MTHKMRGNVRLCSTPDVQARFWSKVDRGQGPNACWLWNGSRNEHGYGKVRIANRLFRAHHVAWIMTFGELPAGRGYHGTCVLHRCDTPACVRPTHLFLGTQHDNVLDMLRKGRANRPFGERNGRAKLTIRAILRAEKAVAAGKSIRAVARELGVNNKGLWNALARRTWQSIPRTENTLCV